MPGYKREVVYKDDNCEVVLITWEPGATTPIHDHGESIGRVTVLRGVIEERFYDSEDCVWSPWLKRPVGPDLREAPGDIHVMSNRSGEAAVTLHIYRPPLVMKIYEPRDVAYPAEINDGEFAI